MRKQLIRTLCTAAALTFTMSVAASAASDMQKLDERVAAAQTVLHEIMDTPDKGIPESVAAKAKCVAVVPGFKKGAFIVGAQYGQGVVTCRTAHGWSAPAFIQLTGASFGFQAGGQSTDLILIGTTHDSAQRLLHDKLKLGGDASVAAGPVGRDAQASTTELANAAFLTYSRNKGIFAGIDLTGDVVNQNREDTTTYYGGKDLSYETILSGGASTPPGALPFVRTVGQLFRVSRAAHSGQ
jgi:lipid-binding SYLF domain-containing protein